MTKKNYSYVGISFIILIFGIFFIPKIVDRIQNKSITKNDRLNIKTDAENQSDLVFLEINNERKKVPNFSFTNQDGKTITNKDY